MGSRRGRRQLKSKAVVRTEIRGLRDWMWEVTVEMRMLEFCDSWREGDRIGRSQREYWLYPKVWVRN